MADSVVSQSLYATPGSQPSTTSAAAAVPGMSTSGKSGTTTSNNDLWFVGFTPYYTAGIWSGYDNNGSITGGTSYHKAIWRNIMTRIHEGLPDPGFVPPDSVEKVEICRKSGKLPVPGVCSSDPRGDATYTEYFAKGTAPTETCDCQVSEASSVCGVSGGRPTAFCPETSLYPKPLWQFPTRAIQMIQNMRFLEPAAYTLVPPPLSIPIQRWKRYSLRPRIYSEFRRFFHRAGRKQYPHRAGCAGLNRFLRTAKKDLKQDVFLILSQVFLPAFFCAPSIFFCFFISCYCLISLCLILSPSSWA